MERLAMGIVMQVNTGTARVNTKQNNMKVISDVTS
jgi:hypothetical protein